MTPQTRARLKLVGVMLMFAGPLAFAYLLYYGLSYGGPATNEGNLVSPAVRLPNVSLTRGPGPDLVDGVSADGTVPSGQVLEEKWSILQVAPEGCGEACIQSLEETRQIRALLHRRVARVQRILILPAQEAGQGSSGVDFEQHPDLSVYRTDDLSSLTAPFAEREATAAGTVYLVDPLGNWMLYYPPGGDGGALFKDVKHLLKLSHIG